MELMTSSGRVGGILRIFLVFFLFIGPARGVYADGRETLGKDQGPRRGNGRGRRAKQPRLRQQHRASESIGLRARAEPQPCGQPSTNGRPVTAGIIAAAGLGTRFLPPTLVMPKEMLPLAGRATIEHTLREFVDSGLQRIVVVTRPESLYHETMKLALSPPKKASPAMYRHLKATGKLDKLADLERLHEQAEIIVVKQKRRVKLSGNEWVNYGNAMPLLSAEYPLRPELKRGETVLFAFGDDVIAHDRDAVPFTRQIIDAYKQHGDLVVGVQEVPREHVNRYGIVLSDSGTGRVTGIPEKPEPDRVKPPYLAHFGRDLIDADVFAAAKNTRPGKDGELWMVDVIMRAIEHYGKRYRPQSIQGGRWVTTGDQASMLMGELQFAQRNPHLLASPAFRDAVRELYNVVSAAEAASSASQR